MNKLYQKNELLFSIIIIFIYIFGETITELISNAIGIRNIVTVFFQAFYILFLMIFIVKNKLLNKYHFNKTPFKLNGFIFFFPLFLVTPIYLWFGTNIDPKPVNIVFSIIYMLFAGFIEELLFTGFLFTSLIKKTKLINSLLITSLIFGSIHLLYFVYGTHFENADIITNCLYAVAGSILFCLIVYKSKSIYPCIVTHMLFNVFRVFNMGPQTYLINTVILVILMSIAILYSIILLKFLPKEE